MVKFAFIFASKESYDSFCKYHAKNGLSVLYPNFRLRNSDIEIYALHLKKEKDLVHFFHSMHFDNLYVFEKNKYNDELKSVLKKYQHLNKHLNQYTQRKR